MEVADASKSSPKADTDGRRHIGKHFQTQSHVEVTCERLKPQTVGGTTAYAAQLGFPAGERHRSLRGGPMLDAMATTHCDTPRSGASRGVASSEVRVHIYSELGHHWLIVELIDKARHANKESLRSFQGFDSLTCRAGELAAQLFC